MATSTGSVYRTLIDAASLAAHLDDPAWAIVDCRFALADPEIGARAYRAGHIPGAVYAHLERDLSSPVVPGRTGRHPLPDPEVLAGTLTGWGIDADVQVVAYDDAGGAMAAARLWWLLGWLGHDAAAVLDGGWAAWIAEARPVRTGVESRAGRPFVARVEAARVVGADEVLAAAADPNGRLLDARAADRFRGENETIDPVAGHIPGALSAPFSGNLDPGGRFLSAAALRARYRAILADAPAERTVVYCGSGVTAAHDVLALSHAGLGAARLYAGSWSEWITDPARLVERGT